MNIWLNSPRSQSKYSRLSNLLLKVSAEAKQKYSQIPAFTKLVSIALNINNIELIQLKLIINK